MSRKTHSKKKFQQTSATKLDGTLPAEIWSKIFSYLSVEQLLDIQRVSRDWATIVAILSRWKEDKNLALLKKYKDEGHFPNYSLPDLYRKIILMMKHYDQTQIIKQCMQDIEIAKLVILTPGILARIKSSTDRLDSFYETLITQFNEIGLFFLQVKDSLLDPHGYDDNRILLLKILTTPFCIEYIWKTDALEGGEIKEGSYLSRLLPLLHLNQCTGSDLVGLAMADERWYQHIKRHEMLLKKLLVKTEFSKLLRLGEVRDDFLPDLVNSFTRKSFVSAFAGSILNLTSPTEIPTEISSNKLFVCLLFEKLTRPIKETTYEDDDDEEEDDHDGLIICHCLTKQGQDMLIQVLKNDHLSRRLSAFISHVHKRGRGDNRYDSPYQRNLRIAENKIFSAFIDKLYDLTIEDVYNEELAILIFQNEAISQLLRSSHERHERGNISTHHIALRYEKVAWFIVKKNNHNQVQWLTYDLLAQHYPDIASYLLTTKGDYCSQIGVAVLVDISKKSSYNFLLIIKDMQLYDKLLAQPETLFDLLIQHKSGADYIENMPQFDKLINALKSQNSLQAYELLKKIYPLESQQARIQAIWPVETSEEEGISQPVSASEKQEKPSEIVEQHQSISSLVEVTKEREGKIQQNQNQQQRLFSSKENVSLSSTQHSAPFGGDSTRTTTTMTETISSNIASSPELALKMQDEKESEWKKRVGQLEDKTAHLQQMIEVLLHSMQQIESIQQNTTRQVSKIFTPLSSVSLKVTEKEQDSHSDKEQNLSS